MRILTGLVGAGLTLAAVCGVSAEYVLTPEATREIQDMLASGEWGIRTSWPLANDADQRAANTPVEFVPITVHVVRSFAGSEGVSLIKVDAAIATANRQFNDPNDPDHDVETGYFGYKFYRKSVVFLDSDEYFWFHYDGGEFGRLIEEGPIDGTVNAYFVPHFVSFNGVPGASTLPYGPGAKGLVIANDSIEIPIAGESESPLPHELGHYFGLLHTHEWSANGDECASGDGCEFGGDLICETPADPGSGWDGNFFDTGAYCYRCDTPFSHPYDPGANNGAGGLEAVSCVWSDVDCDDRGADCEIPYNYCEDEPGVLCHAYEPMTENIMSYYQPEDPSTSRFVPEQLSLMRAMLKFRFADHVEDDFDCNGNDLPDSFEIESVWYPDIVDCDENGRPDGCDIELTPSLDCDGNGKIDSCEIENGDATDCDENDFLDICDIVADPDTDCDFDGRFDICEIQEGDGTDCDGNMRMDSCEVLDDQEQYDCNENNVFDLCELQEGDGTDCNGNGRLDFCELRDDPTEDCNGNGVFDSCDLEAGDATDCNNNGRLDSCDLATNPDLDCDGNGVFDACDILSGEEEDCNNNEIPDSCEKSVAGVTALLTDPDPDWHAYLGTSASIYGGVAVSGSPGDDSGAANAGAIAVFEWSALGEWSLIDELTAAAASNNDGLGASVSIGEGVIAAGAPGDDDMGNGAGSAIVFRWTDGSWSEETVLHGSNTDVGDQFGSTLVMDGTRMAVAAPMGEPDETTGAAGQVYVFGDDGTSWTEHNVVSPVSGDEGDAFGTSIALDGDRMLIGSPGNDSVALNAGAARFFDYDLSGWQPSDMKLTDPNGLAHDAFGTSADFDSGWAAVGAPLSSTAGPSDAGSVVLFREVNGIWTHHDTLVASNARAGDRFGSQLALDGSVLLIGSPYYDGSNPILGNTGQVYVFVLEDDTWTEAGTVQPLFPEIGMLAGSAIGMRGGRAIIGAPGADGALDDSGGAFISLMLDCDLDGELDSCALADGIALDCDGDGIVDSCGIDMDIAEDCNSNAIPDSCDIAADAGLDTNSNGVIDSCEGLADITNDGVVGLNDLIMLLEAWGTSSQAADLDGDNTVGVLDLILLLEMWNPTA
jgi:hypothetical protein